MSQFERLIYGHRGAPTELPENTLPSFRRAVELGVTAIETDVHLTVDGHVVISHDPTGMRMADRADEIRNHTLAEVRTWDVGCGFRDNTGRRPFMGHGFQIPTLEEVLSEFSHIRFNVDAKQQTPNMVEPLLRLVHRLGAEHRVRIASFHAPTLQQVRAAGYGGSTGLAQREVTRLALLPFGILRRWPLGGNAAQVPRSVGPVRFDRKAFIHRCHGLGMRVDFWTIDDPTEARRLLALGADGIMTDDPAIIVPACR